MRPLLLLFSLMLIALLTQTNAATISHHAQSSDDKPQSTPAPATPTSQTPTTSPLSNTAAFVKIDDIAILRSIYPQQSLIVAAADPHQSDLHRFHVGLNGNNSPSNHTVAVMHRTIGKFLRADAPAMLAMVGIDTAGDKDAPLPTGVYAVIVQIDKQGDPTFTRAEALDRQIPPFGNKRWQPAVVTDMNFDKVEDLIMLSSERGHDEYSIYSWNAINKEFSQISEHPALTVLNFYAQLDAAAHSNGDKANNNLTTAYELCSPKLQGQLPMDNLKRRLQDVNEVTLTGLKVMIKSDSSALIRVQYTLSGSGGDRNFEADYNIRRNNDQWNLDNERIHAAITSSKPIG